MYICVCKAITEKQIQEAAQTSSTMKEAFKKLGLGSDCGMCVKETMSKFISQTEKNPSTKSTKS